MRVLMVDLAPGFRQVALTWGYAEEPNVPEGPDAPAAS